MSDSAATPQPCTTWSNRKKHLSDDLIAQYGGRTGRTLCGARAYDDVALASRTAGWTPIRTADLPACKRCEARSWR